MWYRAKKAPKTESPQLEDLSKLSLVDLKKVKKAHEAYIDREEEYQDDIAPIIARNNRIEQENKQIRDSHTQWMQKDNLLQKEISTLTYALQACKVGLFDFFSDYIEYEGKFYKITPGNNLVEKLKEIKKLAHLSFLSKPNCSAEHLDLIPPPPKAEKKLKIGGVTLKINFNSIDTDLLDDLIERHELRLENEKAKLNHLKSRAATSENETRQQAQKFRRLLHKQLAIVPCCPYCAGSLTDKNYHLDHIYPVSRGGKSYLYNLVFVCSKCNSDKGAMTLQSFILKIGRNEQEIYERLKILKKDW